MRRPGRILSLLFLAALLLIASFGAFWFGLVPQRYSPLAPISLDEPPPWFLDMRLAALRRDPELCRMVLHEPQISAAPVPDRPITNGCGWVNGFSITAVGGANLGADKLTCGMSAALALWITYDVQPHAVAMFGSRVASVEDFGTYACRNIIGSEKWRNLRSQHAAANAIDIAGFRLEDGTKISVANDWTGSDSKARFLHAIHETACNYFRVAIGPNYNKAHHDHFHYDRGAFRKCQ